MVRVLLPAGYSATRTQPYPLLLLHDGQNLFDSGSTAPGGGSWHVDQSVHRLLAAGRIPPLIVAGIDHAREDRIDEFTPTPAGKPDAGRAADYARFVVAQVLPQLAADYHVRVEADGLGLGGSSMGGLVTLWTSSCSPASSAG